MIKNLLGRIQSFTVLLTVFLSAMLLFTVQPLVAKELLPRFGGTAAVWGATLVFFQLALLIGYVWSHCILTYVKHAWALVLQLLLIILSVAINAGFLKSEVTATETSNFFPGTQVLLDLWSHYGCITLVLCTTSPLIQGFLRPYTSQGKSLYRLYALSNIGSLIGLLVFPFLLEPNLDLATIFDIWNVTYGIYVFCFLLFLGSVSTRPRNRQGIDIQTPLVFDWSWCILPALSSALLLSITQYCIHDIAAAPLFWIIPLALYLVSWIVPFSELFPYRRRYYLVLLVLAIGVAQYWPTSHWIGQWIVHSMVLFAGCALCHGELSLRKPPHLQLTQFYVASAFGSCVGAIFISFIAPYLFTAHIDYQFSLYLLVSVIILLVLTERYENSSRTFGVATMLLCSISMFGIPYFESLLSSSKVLERKRNFYGVVAVNEASTPNGYLRSMDSGMTNHGGQLLAPSANPEPITYFGPQSGAGYVLRSLQLESSRNIGVIGLGVGTLSYYARANDVITFFEINPAVIELAYRWFSFLSTAKTRPEIIEGDARIQLASRSDTFDILVVDAFSGDAIPAHLLTLEAMRLFRSRLSADGILIYHVSNRFLALAHVLAAQSDMLGVSGLSVVSKGSPTANMQFPSEYFIITHDTILQQIQDGLNGDTSVITTPSSKLPRILPWTDAYSNILAALK